MGAISNAKAAEEAIAVAGWSGCCKESSCWDVRWAVPCWVSLEAPACCDAILKDSSRSQGQPWRGCCGMETSSCIGVR